MSDKGPQPPGGDQNHTQALFVMTIVMLTLSCVFVGLRIIVRACIVKGIWWDDWTIIFALLGTIIGAGLDFPEFVLGYGHHRYFISDPAYSHFSYYSYGEWIQTFATLMWTKVSITLFLYRIPVTKALKRPLQIMVVLLVVSNLIFTLLWILQCLPVSAVWDEEERKTAKCFTKEQLLQVILAQGIISAISDFVLAAYPGLILIRLKMSIRKKVGLWLLMGLGCITGVCCVVRNVLNWTNESQDSTWDSIPNWMWRTLEVNFGIAAACLPALYPGYKAAQKKIASIKSSRRSSGSSKKDPFTGAPVGKKRPARTDGWDDGWDDGRIADLPIPEAAVLKMTEVSLHQSPPDGAESVELLRTVDIRNYGRQHPRNMGGDLRVDIDRSLARIESEQDLRGLRTEESMV